MSIVVTLVLHYVSYFCLILRARRIFKIIMIEDRYLDQIYDPNVILNQIKHVKKDESVNSSQDNTQPLI